MTELPTINSMMQSSADGKIWLSTFNIGILVYDPAEKNWKISTPLPIPGYPVTVYMKY
ncbi:MAG: hypothetical protein LUD15_12285 [Bacteroides sp.]|nr:hypothetical protein [Bacteroides sp.]